MWGAATPETLTATPPQRREALLAAKLRALVGDGFGITGAVTSTFAAGAALLDGAEGAGRGWLLIDGDPTGSFGSALAWGSHHHVEELHLLVEDGAGALARRAALFGGSLQVWWVQGSELHRTQPEPLPSIPPLPEAPDLEQLFARAGLEIVGEYAHVAGELLGLEVARIVSTAERPEPRLEVGVGQADRELTAMLHGDLSPEAALARVVGIVAEHRSASAPPHPLNQLVPERWLRAVLTQSPALVGLASVVPARPPSPRAGLRERGVAFGTGTTPDGRRVVLACSVGMDLDLVPAAAEAREAIDRSAALLLVLPRRDLHPLTSELAASLREPAVVATVDDAWRALTAC